MVINKWGSLTGQVHIVGMKILQMDYSSPSINVGDGSIHCICGVRLMMLCFK